MNEIRKLSKMDNNPTWSWMVVHHGAFSTQCDCSLSVVLFHIMDLVSRLFLSFRITGKIPTWAEMRNIPTHSKQPHTTRYSLDVSISKIKHDELDHLPNHCHDEACLELAAAAWGDNYNISLYRLQKSLVKNSRFTRLIRQHLTRIPHVEIHYEQLYYNNYYYYYAANQQGRADDDEAMVNEWRKALEFVGAHDVANALDFHVIQSKITHMATHPPFRNQTLANYPQVEALLRGTEFEALLAFP